MSTPFALLVLNNNISGGFLFKWCWLGIFDKYSQWQFLVWEGGISGCSGVQLNVWGIADLSLLKGRKCKRVKSSTSQKFKLYHKARSMADTGLIFLGVSSTSQGPQRGPNSALRNRFFMCHLISLWLVRTCKFTSPYEL